MIAEVIDGANNLIWSIPLIAGLLIVGLYFTIRTGLLQIRNLPDMINQLKKGEVSPDGTSSFQSLMMSLAGRVGMGNIGGVATAIAFGGPGAVFWMWVSGFLGASTSFIECTLGQIYKEKDPDTGEYRGGPAFYFERAYKHKAPRLSLFYAILFSIVTIVAMSFFLPGVQANGMASAIDNAWGVPTWVTAIGLVILLGFIVIGGVKRIAHFAVVAVPVMAIAYIIIAIVVFFMNFEEIPRVFGLIFGSAFGVQPIFGAIIGLAVKWGVQRGIYSNEAGQGTGPHAAAAAEVSHPAKQGFAQSFSVYVDTLLVCSATAFIIISTGMFNTFSGDYPGADTATEADTVGRGIGDLSLQVEPGPGYVQGGLDAAFPGWGPTFIAIALAFFVFTTIVAYYYMAEVNLTYLTRKMKNREVARALFRILQALVLVSVAYGAVTSAGAAWGLGDIGVGSMAWLNVIGILFLQVPALKALKDYREQKKAGLDPQFDPRKLGIKNAEFWERRADGHTLQGRTGGELEDEDVRK
ncbi:MAG: alanine:cation symporter family protein [Brachybacterium sp.]|nr:alanine:cation symporter family protein [Brachybacterium sp.]